MQPIRLVTRLFRLAAAATLAASALLATAAVAQDTQAQALPEHWDRATAATLVSYIDGIGSQGLNPADYQPAQLQKAIDSGDPQALEDQATRSFSLVAEDLAIGHVPPDKRGRYYIAPNTLSPMLVARMIDIAITAHQVSWVLDSFAPQNPQYGALRTALAALPPGPSDERTKILATLERWRWFPHNPGSRYLVVNIPEFRARLYQDGRVIDEHKVIVGKTSTPTPQFSTKVIGVIINPSWHVPQSIIAESVGSLVRNRPGTASARGYTWSSAGGRLNVTQQPGPTNALGQLKLDMPNPLSVFMHDTPSKQLFDNDTRAFSHGCIRTQDPFGLAAKLLENTSWTLDKIDATVATRVTTRVALPTPVPAYAVYMTAVPQADGSVEYLNDPYKLDAGVVAQL